MNVENLYDNLEQANTLDKLSKSFDEITKALNKSCNNVFQCLFDYKFSTFLYYHYIILNKTKREIANEINLHPSTVYYYIRKYKIKKDNNARQKHMLETMKQTCNDIYGVDHPGELLEAHRKRIENILIKSNGNYSKSFYTDLNRSKETIEKMKIAQQCRRNREKIEGDMNE